MINYSRSSLSIISSILKYYGYDSGYATLEELDQIFIKKPKTVVLLVLDGLGSKILDYHTKNGFLNKHKLVDVSSVFPPTTVAAINTLESGLPPCRHGWLGWSLYFKEFEKYIDIFPYRDSITAEPIPMGEVNGKTILEYQDVYTKIKESTNDIVSRYVIHPGYIFKQGENFDTFYTQNNIDTFKLINDFSKMNFPKYIYAYSVEPDYTMHDEGANSEKANEVIQTIEKGIEEYLTDLEDTLILITDDHGIINVDEYIDISEIEELDSCLTLRPFIETRTTSYFVSEDKKDIFEKEFTKRFGNHFLLLTKEEVLKQKIFGEGRIHPKFYDFIGDFISIAISNKCIVYNDDRKSVHYFKAHHAGLTEAETTVPLIVLYKDK